MERGEEDEEGGEEERGDLERGAVRIGLGRVRMRMVCVSVCVHIPVLFCRGVPVSRRQF